MASKRRLRRKVCQAKVRHRTREFAQIARIEMIKRKMVPAGVMDIYHCSYCGGFHIGHRKGLNRRAF